MTVRRCIRQTKWPERERACLKLSQREGLLPYQLGTPGALPNATTSTDGRRPSTWCEERPASHGCTCKRSCSRTQNSSVGSVGLPLKLTPLTSLSWLRHGCFRECKTLAHNQLIRSPRKLWFGCRTNYAGRTSPDCLCCSP